MRSGTAREWVNGRYDVRFGLTLYCSLKCLELVGLGTGMVSSVCGGLWVLVSWLSACSGMSGTSGGNCWISGAVGAGCGWAGQRDYQLISLAWHSWSPSPLVKLL